MKPEDRALLVVVLVIAGVVAPMGAYILLMPVGLPTSLPIPAGTAFTMSDSDNWTAHFSVGSNGGTLIGGWTAYDVLGYVGLVVVNGTVPKPPPLFILCPRLPFSAEQNGTADQVLAPGAHTVYWSTGSCSAASQIVVTRTIRVVPA